jgi:coenzyme Q-binding protein COQ10
MARHAQQVDLPYTPTQVYDLVADIESYPQFLPHVASARIRARHGNTWLVEQQFRFKMLRLPFNTRAVLIRPESINVVCADSPFGTFTEHWSFAPIETGGTRLRSETDFAFRNGLLRATLSEAFETLQGVTLQAFHERARALYGARPGAVATDLAGG